MSSAIEDGADGGTGSSIGCCHGAGGAGGCGMAREYTPVELESVRNAPDGAD